MPKIPNQTDGVIALAADLVDAEGFNINVFDGEFAVRDENTGVVSLEHYLTKLCAAGGEQYIPVQGEIEYLAFCLGAINSIKRERIEAK